MPDTPAGWVIVFGGWIAAAGAAFKWIGDAWLNRGQREAQSRTIHVDAEVKLLQQYDALTESMRETLRLLEGRVKDLDARLQAQEDAAAKREMELLAELAEVRGENRALTAEVRLLRERVRELEKAAGA